MQFSFQKTAFFSKEKRQRARLLCSLLGKKTTKSIESPMLSQERTRAYFFFLFLGFLKRYILCSLFYKEETPAFKSKDFHSQKKDTRLSVPSLRRLLFSFLTAFKRKDTKKRKV